MSSDLGPVGDVDGAGWRSVLGLSADEEPVSVVVEGTWWREKRTQARLARLTAVRELGVPDVFIGAWAGRKLLYACPYGAPRTAEIVQIAVLAGARLAIQIGSCGIVGSGIRPGDVIVPDRALGLDGVTGHYADDPLSAATSTWIERASEGLRNHAITTHSGPTVTWPTLFNQPVDQVRAWQRDGYFGVDMETAATLAVAGRFGADGISMLVAWDEVMSGRSFLDPLPQAEAEAFTRAEELLFDVALELVEAV